MVSNRSSGSGDAQRIISYIPDPPPVTGDPETLRSWSSRQFRALSLELDKVQRALNDQNTALAGVAVVLADLDARLAVLEADEWNR